MGSPISNSSFQNTNTQPAEVTESTRKRRAEDTAVQNVALGVDEQAASRSGKRQRRGAFSASATSSLSTTSASTSSLSSSFSAQASSSSSSSSSSSAAPSRVFVEKLQNAREKEYLALECTQQALIEHNPLLLECSKLKGLSLIGPYLTGETPYHIQLPESLQTLCLQDQDNEVWLNMSHFLLGLYQEQYKNTPLRKSVTYFPAQQIARINYSFPNGELALRSLYKAGVLSREGQAQGGAINGQGRAYQADGSLWYSGNMRDNSFSGYGELNTNGDHYCGSFERGKANGMGKLVRADGTTFVGEFFNNKPHGRQEVRMVNGDWYKGIMVEGRGRGPATARLRLDNGTFEGDLFDGKPHGKGTFYFDNGDRYEGSFANGDFDGDGRLFYSLGLAYEEGSWLAGKKNGVFTSYDDGKETGWSFWIDGERQEGVGQEERLTILIDNNIPRPCDDL